MLEKDPTIPQAATAHPDNTLVASRIITITANRVLESDRDDITNRISRAVSGEIRGVTFLSMNQAGLGENLFFNIPEDADEAQESEIRMQLKALLKLY
ncbi:MAG: hypothetical protein WCJ84_00695 [Candidatus Peregrinibacteria bacterium]